MRDRASCYLSDDAEGQRDRETPGRWRAVKRTGLSEQNVLPEGPVFGNLKAAGQCSAAFCRYREFPISMTTVNDVSS